MDGEHQKLVHWHVQMLTVLFKLKILSKRIPNTQMSFVLIALSQQGGGAINFSKSPQNQNRLTLSSRLSKTRAILKVKEITALK